MKQILPLAFSILLSAATYAQSSPGKTTLDPRYDALIGKDIGTVMKAIGMTAKDTIGKTGVARMPQVYPNVKFHYLTVKGGELLLFKDNALSEIVPPNGEKPKPNPFSK